MVTVKTHRKCPICRSPDMTSFLRREGVPVHQNIVMPDLRSALNVPRGILDLAVCERCGFVSNQSFDPDILRYDECYDNTQSYSQFFQDYLAHLAEEMIREKGIQRCRIIEVGCGKGAFLKYLVGAEGAGNTGHGFDPSYAGPLVELDGRLRFERRYYDATCADVSGDAVVCRHVIEHVPDPGVLLRAIRMAVSNSPRPKFFLETPCVEWILRHRVFWDFFYEHCSYFTAQSLTAAVELAGFRVESVRHVFQGQYLWLEATLGEGRQDVTLGGAGVPGLAKEFAASEEGLRKTFEARIHDLVRRDGRRAAIWGAGAKGVTFANLVDSGREWFSCVVDLNPHKQAHFLSGTGHPIVSYHDLPSLGVTRAVLMNPNYHDENLGMLREAGIAVQLIDLMN